MARTEDEAEDRVNEVELYATDYPSTHVSKDNVKFAVQMEDCWLVGGGKEWVRDVWFRKNSGGGVRRVWMSKVSLNSGLTIEGWMSRSSLT